MCAAGDKVSLLGISSNQCYFIFHLAIKQNDQFLVSCNSAMQKYLLLDFFFYILPHFAINFKVFYCVFM